MLQPQLSRIAMETGSCLLTAPVWGRQWRRRGFPRPSGPLVPSAGGLLSAWDYQTACDDPVKTSHGNLTRYR